MSESNIGTTCRKPTYVRPRQTCFLTAFPCRVAGEGCCTFEAESGALRKNCTCRPTQIADFQVKVNKVTTINTSYVINCLGIIGYPVSVHLCYRGHGGCPENGERPRQPWHCLDRTTSSRATYVCVMFLGLLHSVTLGVFPTDSHKRNEFRPSYI